jgi:hypothetical protein
MQNTCLNIKRETRAYIFQNNTSTTNLKTYNLLVELDSSGLAIVVDDENAADHRSWKVWVWHYRVVQPASEATQSCPTLDMPQQRCAMLSGVLGVINTPSTAASCVVNVNLVGWWLVDVGRFFGALLSQLCTEGGRSDYVLVPFARGRLVWSIDRFRRAKHLFIRYKVSIYPRVAE